MIPGENGIRGLALVCLLSLGYPASAWFGVAALTALGATILLCGVEALRLRRVEVTALRAPSQVFSLGTKASLALRLKSSSPRLVTGRLRQTLPPLFAEPAAENQLRLSPGEVARVEWPVVPRMRGRASLVSPVAAITEFGFVERKVEVQASASEIRVAPSLKDLRRVSGDLERFVLRGFGARAAARLGKGRDFDRLRDYVPGDDMRDIAWKVSARRSRLTVREYRLDRSQEIVICVDRGLRMSTRVGSLSRLDHAVHAALLLAYACQRMEDNTSAVSFAAQARIEASSGRGNTQLRRMLQFAVGAAETNEASDYLALAAHLRARIRHRSLIVILTSLPDADSESLLRGLKLLAPQHLPLLIVLQDLSLEAAASSVPESREALYKALAARDLVNRRREILQEARARGAMVVETTPSDAGFAAINAYLEVKRRQSL